MEEREEDSQEKGEDCSSSFVWDDTTQLYFHARSGFYHDPNAGWYYSSRDGLYYKFENGNYLPLQYNTGNDCEYSSQETVHDNSIRENLSTEPFCNTKDNISSLRVDQSDSEVYPCSGTVPDESIPGDAEHGTDQETEFPPPPSEWLEETLINLYLSGYKQAVNEADVSTMSLEVNGEDSFTLPADGALHDDAQMLEDGDRILEHHCRSTDECESIIDKDVCRDEENWQAQYGQVVRSVEEPQQDFHAVDLWDWSTVTDSRKDKGEHTTRLVGRLVKRSAKLHPSMPSSGGLFKTAPICEAHLDLVRVRTGQIYKLHSPSAKYLASMSSYDSSNPTIDWGFPELSINDQATSAAKSHGKSKPKLAIEGADKGVPTSSNIVSISKKQRVHEYRDRAAERRTLHGSFGVGPGQKSALDDNVFGATSPVSTSEEAAAEALNMSFGAGSYARKILENMGWKEGEALGSTRKGLIEPIQAVRNMGNAGLGWPQGRVNK